MHVNAALLILCMRHLDRSGHCTPIVNAILCAASLEQSSLDAISIPLISLYIYSSIRMEHACIIKGEEHLKLYTERDLIRSK